LKTVICPVKLLIANTVAKYFAVITASKIICPSTTGMQKELGNYINLQAKLNPMLPIPLPPKVGTLY
jgi:hypothetical protein